MADMFNWMAWTKPTAAFFLVIATILVVMTIAEIKKPTVERKGFLPIATTRGDRLFIGLLTSAFIHLGVVGATSLSLYWALAFCVLWILSLLRWG
jgi:predicted small integral membrane protein